MKDVLYYFGNWIPIKETLFGRPDIFSVDWKLDSHFNGWPSANKRDKLRDYLVTIFI